MIIKRSFDPRKVAAYVWRDVLFAIVVATLVYGVAASQGWLLLGPSFAPLGLLGTALSIVLALRANTAFARWNEAAQSWAAIHAASRIFARLVVTFTDSHRHTPQYNQATAETFKREMVQRQIAWSHALRLQLRNQTNREDVVRWLPDGEQDQIAHHPNLPLALMTRQGERIYEAMASGILQGFDSFQMEGQLAALSSQQAVCERIKSIPIPRQYDYFTRLFVRLFLIALPIFSLRGLAADGLAWAVIPLTALVAFLFVTIERIGAVNEEPFENRITDVPLSAYCRQIERDLLATLGERELPPAPSAQDGYLW